MLPCLQWALTEMVRVVPLDPWKQLPLAPGDVSREGSGEASLTWLQLAGGDIAGFKAGFKAGRTAVEVHGAGEQLDGHYVAFKYRPDAPGGPQVAVKGVKAEQGLAVPAGAGLRWVGGVHRPHTSATLHLPALSCLLHGSQLCLMSTHHFSRSPAATNHQQCCWILWARSAAAPYDPPSPNPRRVTRAMESTLVLYYFRLLDPPPEDRTQGPPASAAAPVPMVQQQQQKALLAQQLQAQQLQAQQQQSLLLPGILAPAVLPAPMLTAPQALGSVGGMVVVQQQQPPLLPQLHQQQGYAGWHPTHMQVGASPAPPPPPQGKPSLPLQLPAPAVLAGLPGPFYPADPAPAPSQASSPMAGMQAPALGAGAAAAGVAGAQAGGRAAAQLSPEAVWEYLNEEAFQHKHFKAVTIGQTVPEQVG